jgi:hypothetical protein
MRVNLAYEAVRIQTRLITAIVLTLDVDNKIKLGNYECILNVSTNIFNTNFLLLQAAVFFWPGAQV